jgi:hypothetical protein
MTAPQCCKPHTDCLPVVLVDNLTHFCNIFRCCATWRSSRMFVIINWRSAIFKLVKLILRLRLTQSVITKCFFKRSVFCCRTLAKYEAKLYANTLLLHVHHFIKKITKQHNRDVTKTRTWRECVHSAQCHFAHCATGFTNGFCSPFPYKSLYETITSCNLNSSVLQITLRINYGSRQLKCQNA